MYGPKDGLKLFDREFCRLKMRHAPAGQPTDIDTNEIKVKYDRTLFPT